MSQPIVIAAFYHFVRFPDYQEWKQPLLDFCKARELKGTILLAREGINSTISGTRQAMDEFFAHLRADEKFSALEWKESYAEFQPFGKMKVRLKREIVRMGDEDLDVRRRGHYVAPKDWDALISDPEVVTIDTRNMYETKIGKFEGAIDPRTESFRDFPEWAAKNLDPEKHKKVAMYCTGGIRCEKSTALLKSMGFADVYHLQGGILQYLEDTKNRNNKWQGECFVFDERVAVNNLLEPSNSIRCDGCGDPMTQEDLKDVSKHSIICLKCVAQKKRA